MNKFKNLQTILSLVLSITLVLVPLSPVFAEGEENPLTPIAPLQQVSEPSQPAPPDPNSVSEPSQPEAPEGAPPLQTVAPLQSLNQPQTVPQPGTGETELQSAASPGGATSNGNVGDTTLTTGDATNSTTMSNTGNTNIAGSGAGCCGGSASVVNDNNGAHSDNSASATTTNNNNTGQANSASVANNLNSATVTGQNSTSFNTGNSTINTGDANTTATLYNDINSNLAGASVSEFNIIDDHNGDYILDFGANCILGCSGSGMDVSNTDNGAGSENNASSTTTNNNTLDQENDGTLINNLDLTSNSGDNHASFNNNGDSSINTGDANVSANVVNFLNNNLGGNVILGVVNIFGDLVGDILLPEGFIENCQNCGSGSVANSNNGAHSTNNASSTTTSNENTFQNNDASIENNLILSAESGDNSSSLNTGGASAIDTGDTRVDANLLNIANMNIAGGDWLLVIVNEGGRWIGKILGAPDGANFAGTSGTEFVVDEYGNIYVSNTDNGAGSQNSASSTTTNNTTVTQDNNAHVVNNLNLAANTGGNSSSYNTGGDSTITTGDAQVIANLVNFVNNNITGGKLVVAVVNIFGSWTGDFVMPGQAQRSKTQAGGGTGSASETSAVVNNSQNQASETGTQDSILAKVDDVTDVAEKLTTFVGGFSSFTAKVSKDGSETQVSVLGEKLSPADSVSRAVKVNLAWLVVVLPILTILAAGGYLVKKRVIVVRRAQ